MSRFITKIFDILYNFLQLLWQVFLIKKTWTIYHAT